MAIARRQEIENYQGVSGILDSSDAGNTNADQLPPKLGLDDVIQAVWKTFPQLQVLFQEREIAQGNLTSTQGAFDLNVTGRSISQPLGFYENYRHSLGVSQNVMATGSNVYGGYRVGRGSFPVWYKDWETNEGGEFAIGTTVPLRRNRLIDSRRAGVFRAQQDVAAVEPVIRNEQNFILRDAKLAYWDWLGSGQALQTQRRILELAESRAKVIEPLVEKGDLPVLAKIDNDRLIAQREAKYIESLRKFEASMIKLSLFLRSVDGQMVLAQEEFLPIDFPPLSPLDSAMLVGDLQQATASHPQLSQFQFEIEKARIDIADARNLVMGRLGIVPK